MPYHRDFSLITLDAVTKALEEAPLVPSRKLLKDDLHKRMKLLKEYGLTTLDELQKKLKSQKGFAEIVSAITIPEEYLKILLREINSWQPKPNKLRDFPQTEDGLLSALEKEGLKQSKALYERIYTLREREALARALSLDLGELERLARLCDLSRVRWVNHTFAFMLYEAGYRTVADLAAADIDALYEATNRINREYNFYRNAIGKSDIALTIRAASGVEIEMEYGTLPGK